MPKQGTCFSRNTPGEALWRKTQRKHKTLKYRSTESTVQIWSSFRCTRILSEPRRYGNIVIAEELLEQARDIQFDGENRMLKLHVLWTMILFCRFSGGHTAFGNSATLAAINGNPELAVKYLRKAIELAEKKPTPEIEATKQIYSEMLSALTDAKVYHTVQNWAGQHGRAVGAAAKSRLKVFHGRCQMTLIWF
eukprot:gb/GECG01000204.1/.p1 GENE.gb/GECG01000204.1/~~gb/GECG01000204.1/.p1  ORF type:complete len:193 (+),score=11.22 gb/GECG01000204.1/:1-579(+)